ncbi:IclR family transcriptional regulator [Streptomyces sp. NPDC094448]|uniref:IclR family transcriptional regulator n=1 Tax=Streptomyces sp. NPDC094448 TaxID=3366063 RepID=UPI003822406F
MATAPDSAAPGEAGHRSAGTGGAPGAGARPVGTVQIVDHALQVLKAIAEADRPRGVRELSRDLAISKSSVQRILVSLEHEGLAVADETRKYVIGPAALTLAWKHTANSDLVGAASGTASRIAAMTGETACVSTVVDGRRVTVYEAESPQPLRLITGVGRPYSLFSGATGRVLLSMLPDERVDQLVREHTGAGGEPKSGSGSESGAESGSGAESESVVRARIDAVREQGYAISHQEWIPGGCGVAVPIGTQGSIVAALSIYGPDARLTDQRTAELVPVLRAAAAEITVRWRQPA